MKKRILILALVLSLSMVFAACGSSGTDAVKDAKAEVVSIIDDNTISVKWTDPELQEKFGETSEIDCSEAKLEVDEGDGLVEFSLDELTEGLHLDIDLMESDADKLKAEHILLEEE
ncbi:hypothetical protein M2140_001766 [Clostridiales Family XIII bacterium PM5-7]